MHCLFVLFFETGNFQFCIFKLGLRAFQLGRNMILRVLGRCNLNFVSRKGNDQKAKKKKGGGGGRERKVKKGKAMTETTKKERGEE